jgi:hypothetical protein
MDLYFVSIVFWISNRSNIRNLIVSIFQNASRQNFTVCSILQQGRYSLSAQEKKKKFEV